MPGTKTYFLSDFHLGAKYIDNPRKQEQRIVSFLESIRNDAKEIYLLGDILDYWFEYRYVVPKGYVRFFGKIAELADSGIKIYWFIGNHDIWIFDYLPSELGVEIVDGSQIKQIDGKTFFIAHGDGLGDESRSFRMLRAFFRNRFCQRLYAGIHPRWTVPFALNWSRSNRVNGEDRPFGCDEPLQRFVTNYKEDQKIDYFVFGHRHVAVDKSIGNNSRLIILGDWIKLYSYAVYDGNDLRLQFFTV
ncbi:MAG: UDP-2,3-diacylglucosamine diphosphatase [Bacteroidales bacterium]|nr:UDP-2,3-diacylglucosamine diphosphatase [Bacteroidales bacterium]MDY4942438.1 UDP-2,3-diacylglucosamine diphosphatase [Candidatus Limisoma sp.]MDD6623122.1 UDP-2,3-diacylglucosamine diphosphatase [Bacteroidales bacterium]MDD7604237.1 UDP-2,3-diacylglucosamine diphosphatase [Bacteroidales bacterium]MDD7760900.1 UDP-2,3-diacylglucosamine diphosphatase [Bacteroidales bacterium]